MPEAPDRADVDQPGGGDDDDHAERRRGQRLDQRHREEEEEPDDDRGDQDGRLRLRSGGVVDRGAGVGGGDGKRAGQAADEVRAADRGQLAVGVDLVAVLLGEGPHGRDQVGERDERERRRGKHQIEEVAALRRRHPEGRQATLDLADDRDPVSSEVDERGDHERQREHDEGRRHRRNEAPDAIAATSSRRSDSTVGPFASPSSDSDLPTIGKKSSAPTLIPRSLPNWDAITISATPLM